MRWKLGAQLCRKHAIQSRRTVLYNRWLKRHAARILRRMAKQRLDEAPTQRRYAGWSD